MAQLYNIPARAERNAEAGLVWMEMITNNTGTIQVPKYSTVRVRATGATTVTVDGVLAATMMTDEIMLFNAGIGNVMDSKKTVAIVIGAAAAYVQVARTVEPSPQPQA